MKLGQVCKHLWHSEWLGRTAGLLFLVAVCAGAYWLGTSPSSSGVTAEGLFIEPKYLDFGTIWEQKDFQHKVAITNRGSQAVRIRGFATDPPSCLAINPSKVTLTPGDTQEFTLTLDTRWSLPKPSKSNSARPEGSGTRVTVLDQDQREGPLAAYSLAFSPLTERSHRLPSAWELRGKVRKFARLAPSVIDFGESLVVGSPFQPMRARIDWLAAVQAESADCTPSHGVAGYVGAQSSANGEIEVRCSDRLPQGRFAFEITVRCKDQHGQPVPPLLIPVRGIVSAQLEVLPTAIEFGICTVGDLMKSSIHFRSRKSDPLASLTTDQGTLANVVMPTTQHTLGSAELLFPIQQSGQHSRACRITARTVDGAEIGAVLPVNYYGKMP